MTHDDFVENVRDTGRAAVLLGRGSYRRAARLAVPLAAKLAEELRCERERLHKERAKE